MAYFVITQREYESITLAGKGLRNTEIAKTLRIKPNTVNSYLRLAYKKLNIHNRRELPERLTKIRIRVKLNIKELKKFELNQLRQLVVE